MLVLCDARERGARLTLATGAQRDDLVVRQVPIDLNATEFIDAFEVAALARDLRNAIARAATPHDLAARRDGSLSDGTHPRHVGCEGRDRNAPARVGDQL